MKKTFLVIGVPIVILAIFVGAWWATGNRSSKDKAAGSGIASSISESSEPSVSASPGQGGTAEDYEALFQALTRSDDGQGNVTTEVTYFDTRLRESLRKLPGKLGDTDKKISDLLEKYPDKDFTVFLIGMDTHSVPLDKYDLRALASLSGDEARDGVGSKVKVFSPVDWYDISKGSHHRSGVIVFAKMQSKTLRLVVRKIGGVAERAFEW